jgi:hypothetical protein
MQMDEKIKKSMVKKSTVALLTLLVTACPLNGSKENSTDRKAFTRADPIELPLPEECEGILSIGRSGFGSFVMYTTCRKKDGSYGLYEMDMIRDPAKNRGWSEVIRFYQKGQKRQK